MTNQNASSLFRLLTFSIALGVVCVPPYAIANEFYSINLSVGEETNVPRGLDDFHTLGSVFSKVEFSLGKLVQLGLNDSLLLSSDVGFSRFNELRGFDSADLSLGLSYRHKFGFGPNAPSLNLGTSYNFSRFEGAARDTDSGVIELSVSKQFRSGFGLAAGVDYQRNKTDLLPEDPAVSAFGYDPVLRTPFELFDYESASVFINGDYTFYSGWMLSAGYRRINGATVVSTTTPSLALYKVADGFYTDPAFSAYPGADRWFAYQLETNTDQYSAALSFPVLTDTSIDISASWNDIRALSGRDYDNTIYAISLIHNF